MAEKAEKPDTTKKLAGSIGLLAFLGGIILAIVGGIVSQQNEGIILALVIMGILVGVLNITGKEVLPLLIAAIALLVVGTSSFAPLDKLVNYLGRDIDTIVHYLANFTAPAAVISAIRAIWAVARPG